ncbi:uncharacterized protein LOC124152217 isoform X1 [Haliotis rufescens]|uniref:uncharacterized protein LOC124152217 isoform X1 n=2 Tax=Haliotis rufescens TaxID=6454 RepID=UPI001EB02654|nr:uncharacterized protein LOC124152217 isoform X1 [Haliotis rufescens]
MISRFKMMLTLVNVVVLATILRGASAAQCACATGNVHVRSGVGTSHAILGTLNTGSCVTYKGDETSGWVHVDFNGQSGWIAGNYVNVQTCSGGSVTSGGGSLDCAGGHRYSARGTAYYPANNALEGGFVDMRGARLRTLQQYLAGSASYVSVAMDNHAGIAYGTAICIPEMNHRYNKHIVFKVVDTGSAFSGKGHGRIDICVSSQANSYDSTINGHLTLVFP